MKMYLPFGDWSGDGHCRSEKILIDAPNMDYLLQAQIKIKEKYGQDFFRCFADDYEDASISDVIQQALIDTNYPLENFQNYMDDIGFDNFQTLSDVFNSEIWNDTYCCCINYETAVDMFIWLLNAHGAVITCLNDDNEIPMICNWTCPGFETIGYGLFY